MFHVCRDISGFDTVWNLVNGVMSPQPVIGDGVLFTDLPPKQIAVWLERINGVVYEWQITVDTTSGDTPLGQYYFTDETGDTYSLSALTPFKHTVAYNSAKPFITKIAITLSYPSHVGDWAQAPICGS